MRCYEALGQWNDLNALGKRAFSTKAQPADLERRQKMAVIAARGSWAVGTPLNHSLFQAILHDKLNDVLVYMVPAINNGHFKVTGRV